MSLINEALKRTRDNSFQTGTTRPTTVDAYRVSTRQETTLGSRTGIWVSLLILVIAGAAVLLIALRVTRPGQNLQQALNVVESQTARSESAPYQPEPGRAVSPKPPPVEVAPEPPPVAELPKLVLQGITSAATWREAMINGYTVREGDEVEGVRVVSIETRHVKLQFGDREIVLRMP